MNTVVADYLRARSDIPAPNQRSTSVAAYVGASDNLLELYATTDSLLIATQALLEEKDVRLAAVARELSAIIRQRP